MSISTLTRLAIARRTSGETKAVQLGTGGNAALDAIVAYVPTEVISVYVGIAAALSGSKGEAKATPELVFWVFIVATPVIVWLLFAARMKSADLGVPLHPRKWPW